MAVEISTLSSQLKKVIRFALIFTLLVALRCSLPSAVAAAAPSLEDYRKHALTHQGDVSRGKLLFNDDQRLSCAKCHSVDGSASKAGPDLHAAGDAFGRMDLVDSVLTPSARIAVGYGTIIVETKSGTEFTGILKQTTEVAIQLMGADGKLVSIATTDIKEKRGSSVSFMPEGLQAHLSLPEFTDVIEYLASLQEPASTLASNHGMPNDVPKLEKPPALRPFFTNHFAIPRTKAESGLTSVRQIPGLTNVFLVLHQEGILWKVEKTAAAEEKTLFADLTGEVFYERGPNGLQDIAFHPKFRENRKYYRFYQVFEDGVVTTRIVEKEFAPDFKSDSAKPARVILKIPSVAEDHSGGCLQFGRDGFLYIVMGDTGPQMDPNGHAQNLGLLLGKVLRIDVDHEEASRPYAIPADNPFRGRADARPEIWAYGFRNPWRFSFDRVNGELWAADVGQDRVEEIDIVRRGENYGWSVYEGFEPFSNQYRKEGRTYTMPFFAYRRKYGASVTGGYVYRGDKNSSFYGVYVFGDYVSKRIFGLTQQNGVLKTARQLGVLPQRVVSFCEDEAGNLYAVGYEGKIYQLDFSEARFE
jgi:putative heme-binding domain-containing protein